MGGSEGGLSMGELWTENGLLGKVEDIKIDLANAPDFTDISDLDLTVLNKEFVIPKIPDLDITVLTKEFVIPKEPEFMFECATFNKELFEKLCMPDKTLPMSMTFTGELIDKVQRRRHKKKRINKKWAKRYGYINVYKKINIKDVSVIPNEEGYDFVGGSVDVRS